MVQRGPCANCGGAVSYDVTVCPSCGHDLSSVAQRLADAAANPARPAGVDRWKRDPVPAQVAQVRTVATVLVYVAAVVGALSLLVGLVTISDLTGSETDGLTEGLSSGQKLGIVLGDVVPPLLLCLLLLAVGVSMQLFASYTLRRINDSETR